MLQQRLVCWLQRESKTADCEFTARHGAQNHQGSLSEFLKTFFIHHGIDKSLLSVVCKVWNSHILLDPNFLPPHTSDKVGLAAKQSHGHC